MIKREELPRQIRQYIRRRFARIKPSNVENRPAMDESETIFSTLLADRSRFALSEMEWAKFEAALDSPVRDQPRMRALLQSHGFFDESLAQTRLLTLAAILETDQALLESFLDLLAEEELTDRRIVDAQWVMGLCTPVCSHLKFPKVEPPACGEELLAEWWRRQANPAEQAQAAEEARIRQIRIDHGVFE